MKNFKQLREKISLVDISEKKEMNYIFKDLKSAEFIKKELSGLVKADYKLTRKGSKYHLNIVPKNNQDEKIILSFMDDAKIEMLKDEFIRHLNTANNFKENVEFETFLGEKITITSEKSKKIIEIHDSLQRENQEIFMEMMVYSSETFEQMNSFCESYAENKG